MNQSQYGFIPSNLTTNAIQAVLNIIKHHKENYRNVSVVSLDIKCAFKNTWWLAVLYVLEKTNYAANL